MARPRTGSIHEDKKTGQFTIRWTVDGARKSKRLPVGTKRRDAERALSRLLDQVESGQYTLDGTMPLAVYGERWIEHLRRRCDSGEIKPKTLLGYSDSLKLYIGPSIGHVPLQDLKAIHVREMHSQMLGKGLSTTTAHLAHRHLHTLLKMAMQDELIIKNVAAIVPKPSVADFEGQAHEVHEAQKMIAGAAGHPRLTPLRILLSYMALRRGEVLGITLDRVEILRDGGHITGGWLLADRQLARVDGEHVLISTKTKRSKRRLPLTPQMAKMFADEIRAVKERRLAAGQWWDGFDYDLLFCNDRGGPMDKDTYTGDWEDLCAMAGVKKIRLHDARHTCGTLLAAAGVDPSFRRLWMGHTTEAMMHRYTHPSDDSLMAAASVLDALLA